MEIFTSEGKPTKGVDPNKSTVGISQIKEHKACPRKWFLSSIACIPQGKKEHLLKGTALHKRNELYISKGYPLNDHSPKALAAALEHCGDMTPEELEYFQENFAEAGKIATAGIHLLPPPGSPSVLGVELTLYQWVPLNGPHSGSFAKWRGTIDLLERTPETLYIADHKTASALTFVDDSASLATDVQLLTYSWAATAAGYNPHGLPVTMRKNYFPTKGRFKPFAVEAQAAPARVASIPAMLTEAASAMAVDAGRPENEIRQNLGHCSDFGGCPYRSRCFGPADVIDNIFQVTERRKEAQIMDREKFLTDAIGGGNELQSKFAELSEAGLRLIFTMTIDAAAPESLTKETMLPRLATHFANATPAVVNQWLAYAKANAPSVNPPEQGKAGPASAPAVASAPSAGNTGPASPAASAPATPATPAAPSGEGSRKRSTAGSAEETECRKYLRQFTPKQMRNLVLADGIPAATETFASMRDALGRGEKPVANELVNAVAAEAIARGWDASRLAQWAAAESAPPAPGDRTPITTDQLPPAVAAAAQAAGIVPYGEAVDPAVSALVDSLPEAARWSILRQLGNTEKGVFATGGKYPECAGNLLKKLFRVGLDSLKGWADWAKSQPSGMLADEAGPIRAYLEGINAETFARLCDAPSVSPRFRAYKADPAAFVAAPRSGSAHELIVELQARSLNTWAGFCQWAESVTGQNPDATPARILAPMPPPPAVPVAPAAPVTEPLPRIEVTPPAVAEIPKELPPIPPVPAVAAPSAPPSAPPPVPVAIPSAMPAASGQTVPRVLFVNCYPVIDRTDNPRPESASEVFAGLFAQAASDLKVPHITLAEFNKGYKLAAAMLARAGWPKNAPVIHIDTGADWAAHILPILETQAYVVVRGMR